MGVAKCVGVGVVWQRVYRVRQFAMEYQSRDFGRGLPGGCKSCPRVWVVVCRRLGVGICELWKILIGSWGSNAQVRNDIT